ncbi:hypothetical protein HDU96_004364, partial [Phlyctochytrium bullatum]
RAFTLKALELFVLTVAFVAASASSAAAACGKGKFFEKVLTIILENEDAADVFQDPYLGKTLASQGYLLTNSYGIAHP